jgi:hypothetical protein
MGSKKEKTRQVAVRLPLSLHEFVVQRAGRLHGGDFTAAVIELLSQIREVLVEREAWFAQKNLTGWAKKLEAQQGRQPRLPPRGMPRKP